MGCSLLIPLDLLPSKKRLNAYRYGFNGQEKDNEIKGSGNSYNYGFRMYDSRLGRPLSVDPLFKDFPELSSYQFFSDNPIKFIDLDGLEAVDPNDPNSTPQPDGSVNENDIKRMLIKGNTLMREVLGFDTDDLLFERKSKNQVLVTKFDTKGNREVLGTVIDDGVLGFNSGENIPVSGIRDRAFSGKPIFSRVDIKSAEGSNNKTLLTAIVLAIDNIVTNRPVAFIKTSEATAVERKAAANILNGTQTKAVANAVKDGVLTDKQGKDSIKVLQKGKSAENIEDFDVGK